MTDTASRLLVPVVRWCYRCDKGREHTSPCDGRVLHYLDSGDDDRVGFSVGGEDFKARGPRSLCRRLYVPVLLDTELAEHVESVCKVCARLAGVEAEAAK